jgi:hypothetical protein
VITCFVAGRDDEYPLRDRAAVKSAELAAAPQLLFSLAILGLDQPHVRLRRPVAK